MKTYSSFLICFHPGHTDVFRNGLPLGVIVDGTFRVHELNGANDTKVPVTITAEELNEVVATVDAMRLAVNAVVA